jgi:hypothetical protein
MVGAVMWLRDEVVGLRRISMVMQCLGWGRQPGSKIFE